ncbi:MAG: hypothetical protein RBQ99_03565 [Trichlorobacter sp.]|nr:hypothetical protein [Trichlorobacter sp.]
MRIVYLLMVLLSLTGCATLGFGTKEDCDKAVKDYNRMIRWDEPETAALTYLDNSLQDDFIKTIDDLRRRNVNIADMRIKANSCATGNNSADVIVEFDYFALPDNRIKSVTDKQKWMLLRGKQLAPGQRAGWKLVTPPPQFR